MDISNRSEKQFILKGAKKKTWSENLESNFPPKCLARLRWRQALCPGDRALGGASEHNRNVLADKPSTNCKKVP